MKKCEFTVTGEDIVDLPLAVRESPPRERTEYDGGEFRVITVEKFYLRVGTHVHTAVVMEMTDPTTCKVAVIAGGGTDGYLGDTWGAESKEVERVVEIIEDYSEANGLETDRLSSA